jgi:Tol biopolymer transport system component
MINIASGVQTRLTYNDTFDSFPVFSKDGKKIVFSSNRDAENPRNTNIYIADIVEK